MQYYVQTMYNIKEAAERAGVTVPVLRAWERRYGVVSPPRTRAGYRVFDDAAVGRIQLMRTLIAQGWSPSAAAAAIVAGTAPVGNLEPRPGSVGAAPAVVAGASAADLPGASAPADVHEGARREASVLAERLVQGAVALDPGEVDAVLDDLFSRGSFERVATDLLFPALERLGDAWAAGTVGVAGEHLASSAVLRRLGLALDAAASRQSAGRHVVVGLPPGGRHELGAMAFAVVARRAGMAVTYVGPDLPAEDWIMATRGAAAAVIGVVTTRERNAALEVARRLREAHPSLVVALGGRAARLPASDGILRLPEALAESVATLASVLERERLAPVR